MRARTSETDSLSCKARAVGTTPLGVRKNSGSFSSRRSRTRAWLIADGVRLSRSAAFATWRSSRTVLKTTSKFRSTRERLTGFSIILKSYHLLHVEARFMTTDRLTEQEMAMSMKALVSRRSALAATAGLSWAVQLDPAVAGSGDPAGRLV